MIWGSLVYTYVVVYMGAYVQHMKASTACGGWRIIKLMGQRITKLQPVGGFCADAACGGDGAE